MIEETTIGIVFTKGEIKNLTEEEFEKNLSILSNITAVHCTNCGEKLFRFPYAKIETAIPLGANVIFVEPCKNCLKKEKP